MSEIRIDRWLLAILYLLAFILLREWLLPVMELTDTGHLSLVFNFYWLGICLIARWRSNGGLLSSENDLCFLGRSLYLFRWISIYERNDNLI